MTEIHGETAVLSVATADAEGWLARWFRQGIASEAPPEIREFNAAVTALRRLIDARKALRDYQYDDRSGMGKEAERSADEEIAEGVERVESEGEDPGDSDAMPD